MDKMYGKLTRLKFRDINEYCMTLKINLSNLSDWNDLKNF